MDALNRSITIKRCIKPYHLSQMSGIEGKGTLALSEETDRELIERAKAYDEAALQLIYERYAPGIYRYIYYRVGSPELAEDLRAEVFVRMLEGIANFNYRGWSISAWLYRIAHDRVVDHIRRQKRRNHEVLEEQYIDPSAGPDAVSLARIDHEALREAIKQLTEDQAEVVLLRFVAEHSLKEVAQITGRTEGAVKAMQHRALQTLGRILGSQVDA